MPKIMLLYCTQTFVDVVVVSYDPLSQVVVSIDLLCWFLLTQKERKREVNTRQKLELVMTVKTGFQLTLETIPLKNCQSRSGCETGIYRTVPSC